MNKFLLVAVLLTGLVIYAGSVSFAVEENYTASATMPTTTGFVAYQVLNDTWATTPTTTFAFGTLKEVDVTLPATPNDKKFVFLPNVTKNLYYVILPTGGGLTGTVQATFKATATPSGQTESLGYKTTITYVSTVGTLETPVQTSRLEGGSSFAVGLLSGGSLRMYVGIYDGKTVSNWSTPEAKVFSGADAAGAYGGTLTISVQ